MCVHDEALYESTFTLPYLTLLNSAVSWATIDAMPVFSVNAVLLCFLPVLQQYTPSFFKYCLINSAISRSFCPSLCNICHPIRDFFGRFVLSKITCSSCYSIRTDCSVFMHTILAFPSTSFNA